MTKRVDNEVKRTLESLDNLKSASTDPYFYTRLKGRMEEDSQVRIASKWSLAGTGVVIILNVLFLVGMLSGSTSDTEMIEELAVEYNSAWPSLYNNDLIYENE
ncbi:MAG: hypothetical protein AAF843_02710 [Bacteroidota bacterium]